jgi:hypothetical protein
MQGLSRVVAVATMAISFAGCGVAPSSHVAAVNGAGKAGPDQGARPYVGKPRPPVTVTLAPGASLESGVPGQLTLQVRSGAPLEAVRLVVEGDEGLTVVGFRELPSASNSQEVPGTFGAWHRTTSFEVSATPTSGGTRYVSGLLSFQVNGVDQAVPFTLPVQVGGPVTVTPVSAKPERPPTQDATGELVDSMPAETTVR